MIDVEFGDTARYEKLTLDASAVERPIKRVLDQSRTVDFSNFFRAPHQIGPERIKRRGPAHQ